MYQILILLYIVSLLVCPLLSFRYATAKYIKEGVSWKKAYLYFLFIISLPIAIFILVNLILVGAEEITGKSIITELGARSLLIYIAFGILLLVNVSIFFIVYIRKLNRDKKKI